jgi:hypothetical protein
VKPHDWKFEMELPEIVVDFPLAAQEEFAFTAA